MCMQICASSVPQDFIVLLRQHPEPNKNLLNITVPFASSEQCPKIFPELCPERLQCLPEHSFVHALKTKVNATLCLSPVLRPAGWL